MIVKCIKCGIGREIRGATNVKKASQRSCRKCLSESQRNPKRITCPKCGGPKPRRSAKVCRPCHFKATKNNGPRNVPIGSERMTIDGRVVVKVAHRRWVRRARLVWEQAHGPIPNWPKAVIHHINGDPADDRLENLVCITAAEHTRLHNPRKGKKRA